jgi:hypothetical protein
MEFQREWEEDESLVFAFDHSDYEVEVAYLYCYREPGTNG